MPMYSVGLGIVGILHYYSAIVCTYSFARKALF